MSALDDAKALLPENHQGWDCDGSAMVCDQRLDAMRALIDTAEQFANAVNAAISSADHNGTADTFAAIDDALAAFRGGQS